MRWWWTILCAEVWNEPELQNIRHAILLHFVCLFFVRFIFRFCLKFNHQLLESTASHIHARKTNVYSSYTRIKFWSRWDVMWCGRVEYSPPFFLLREDWNLESIEWLGSEMRCRPGMAEDRDTLKGDPAAAVAGRVARRVKECISSQWPSEPELWPCTTLYRCGKTASLSTDLCSSSARTTLWENTPKRSPNGHILLNPVSEYLGASSCRYSALEYGIYKVTWICQNTITMNHITAGLMMAV